MKKKSKDLVLSSVFEKILLKTDSNLTQYEIVELTELFTRMLQDKDAEFNKEIDKTLRRLI